MEGSLTHIMIFMLKATGGERLCQIRRAWRCQGTRNRNSLVDSSSAHAQDSRRLANPLLFCLLMLAVHVTLCSWKQVLGAADQESALNKVLEKISDLFPDVLAQAAQHRAVEPS